MSSAYLKLHLRGLSLFSLNRPETNIQWNKKKKIKAWQDKNFKTHPANRICNNKKKKIFWHDRNDSVSVKNHT